VAVVSDAIWDFTGSLGADNENVVWVNHTSTTRAILTFPPDDDFGRIRNIFRQ
jgi:hypothetical protein